MGGITTGLSAALPSLGTTLSAANALSGFIKPRVNDNLALKQLQDKQAESLRQTQEDNALSKAEIQVNAQDAERKRQDSLKRAVARQRTQFGSQGISTTGGSSQAILLGLFDESEDDRLQRDRLDGIRTSALDQNVAQQGRLNLLQSSQLAEKQRISRLF